MLKSFVLDFKTLKISRKLPIFIVLMSVSVGVLTGLVSFNKAADEQAAQAAHTFSG